MHPHTIYGIDHFYIVLACIIPLSVAYMARQVTAAGYSFQRFVILQAGWVLIALVGAKLFSLYMRGGQLYSLDYELVNGWRYPGAILALLTLAPIWMRWVLPGYPIAALGDKFAIVLAFSMAAIRISCVLNGCCTGPVCDGHLCLTYHQGSAVWYHHLKQGYLQTPASHSLPVVPLHLYFMLASLAVGVFLLWFERRKQYHGQLVLLYLLLHEGSKGILEFWRVPAHTNLQWVSFALALLAAVLLAVIALRRRRRAST